MIKRFLTIIAILSAIIVKAQDQTSSPYSYYGIGLPLFNGTAENRSMEGMSMIGDSIHLNLQNPAGFGALQLTALSVGITQGYTTSKTSEAEAKTRHTAFDYLAVGIPTGKLNFGFGFLPHSSVGYQIEQNANNSLSKYRGNGGLDDLFLSVGYRIKKRLRVGISANYNFGNIENQSVLFQDNIQYGTLEENKSRLSGFQFNIGAQYEKLLKNKLLLKTSANFKPESKLKSKNNRQISTIALNTSGGTMPVVTKQVDLEDTNFNLPSEVRLGVGIGKFQKWFIGLDYQNIGKTEYKNTSFSSDNVVFKSANAVRIGGFYIPRYNDITNYFKRITFRAGLRYQETGLNINQKDINEFGISFGLGLPAGQYLSNFNIGVEYGQRGTTSAGLIKENFVNIFIGISFNDKWFRERRYH